MLDNSEMNQIHVTHHLWEVGHFALFWRVFFPLYEKKKNVKISAVNDSVHFIFQSIESLCINSLRVCMNFIFLNIILIKHSFDGVFSFDTPYKMISGSIWSLYITYLKQGLFTDGNWITNNASYKWITSEMYPSFSLSFS